MAKKKAKTKTDIYEQFRLPVARAGCSYTYRCHAPEQMFVREFADMPQAMQEAFQVISLPCEGGGKPGPWCSDCGFGEEEIDD